MRVLDRWNQRRDRERASTVWGLTRHAAMVAVACAPLTACVTLDDPDTAGVDDEGGEETGEADSALIDGNGLNPNGWNLNGLNWNGLNWNGLNWNGLHTVGLYTTGGSNAVSSNIQSWLSGEKSASGQYIGLTTMPYLVSCAVPSGTSVTATVNGTFYTWSGKFGLAPGWKDGAAMTTDEQEWVSACLVAHVNLAGAHVEVSFRGAHPGFSTTPAEVASHSCREAAFMGNLFAGHSTQPLPLMQCHELGALSGTGRTCDPSQGSWDCVAGCEVACDGTSGDFSACNVMINGTPTSYSHVVTTYLPPDPTKGCRGWGFQFLNHQAQYESNSSGTSWVWWADRDVRADSCSWHCGGYTQSGASCAPGCRATGSCAADYAAVCGTPPPYSGPTSGVSTCPSGYTSYSGNITSTHTEDYFPSVNGYTPTATGTHHGVLLGPGSGGAGADFDLEVQFRDAGSTDWQTDLISDRAIANESIHDFYGTANRTYRWRVYRWNGTGSYKFCLKKP